MPVTGWIMLAFGCLVLYGGLAICLSIAHRNRGSREREGTGGPE